MCVCVRWGRSWGGSGVHTPAQRGSCPSPCCGSGGQGPLLGAIGANEGDGSDVGASHASPSIGPGHQGRQGGAAGAVLAGGGAAEGGTRGSGPGQGGARAMTTTPPPTIASISVFPVLSLMTHIPHPASSLPRRGEGGGGGAPWPSPGGGSSGLGEGRARDRHLP